MSLSLTKLLTLVGDDKVFVQNLRENMTGCRLRTKGRESAVTFVTGSQFISPQEAISEEPPAYVGLVLWLPAGDIERARLEAAAEGGARG